MEQDNKMTSSNLGIVFGPTLMRPRPTDATISLSSLVDYPHQARIIEALIIFYSTIFENNETTVLADSGKFGTGGEEAASGSDLVGASREGSTLRGCGAAQGSLEPISWGSPSHSPNAPRAPPMVPQPRALPCRVPQRRSPSLLRRARARVWPTLWPFSEKTHPASSHPRMHPHSTCE